MSSLDNEVVKQSVRRLEIPINKFNEVAIPHHLNLLRIHKDNIKRALRLRDWDRVYTEQVNASRIIKQLKQLLYEMDTLRAQVLDCDIAIFDKLTMNGRTSTLNAIKEYLELELNLPLVERPPKKVSDDQTTENPSDDRFLQIQAEQEEVDRQQACLNTWNSLHNDLIQLQQLFIDFNHIVHEQAESVDRIEENVEDTQINIEQGTKSLQQSLKYKVMAYPLAGALLGTCLGGPIGFFAGLKLGGLSAIGGGILGFKGGSMLKKKCSANANLPIEGLQVDEMKNTLNTSNEISKESVNKKDS